MTINYPNGKSFLPHHIKSGVNKQVSLNKPIYGNRGMTLENDINASNEWYLLSNKAVIHKKPVPVQIVSVDYPKRSAAKITEAYFRSASTTDYNGVYKGKYLDFEAKETKNKTSFPLKNFHGHQITHMERCREQDGISFVILRFSPLNRIFLLKIEELSKYWDAQAEGGRKSIPLSEIEKHGFEVSYRIAPRIPYLDIVDQWLEDELNK